MNREKTPPSIPSLSQIAPFDLLDDARLHRMVAASRLVRAERGEILIQAQDVATCMHVVLDGEVVERGTADQVFNEPRHPYAAGLVATARLDLLEPGTRLPTVADHVRRDR